MALWLNPVATRRSNGSGTERAAAMAVAGMVIALRSRDIAQYNLCDRIRNGMWRRLKVIPLTTGGVFQFQQVRGAGRRAPLGTSALIQVQYLQERPARVQEGVERVRIQTVITPPLCARRKKTRRIQVRKGHGTMTYTEESRWS